MRCNQVSILIERFGEYVPKSYPGEIQRISVYVDDFQSVYAALSKAYALAVDELAEYEQIGVRADVRTNECFKSDYREMRAKLPKGRSRHEDDINWQQLYSRLELCEDCMWVFEHSAEILEVIKKSKDTEDMVISLKEKFHLSDFQVKKLLQFRFDMLTQQEYERYRDEAMRLKKTQEGIRGPDFDEEARERHTRTQISKLTRQTAEIKAFLLAADHYAEMIEIMESSDNFNYYAKEMEERFGLSRDQSRYIQHMTIRDFDKKAREEARKKLDRLEREKQMLEKDLGNA